MVKTKKKTGQLFSNNRPETTVHGYGFDTLDHVKKTLADLVNRDSHYQFQVVNTLYQRCLVMQKKKPGSYEHQLKAMKAWLDAYKAHPVPQFDYLPPAIVDQLEAFAEFYGISRKARGLEKPTTSDKGFLTVYREVRGDYAKLRTMPVKASVPHGQTWDKQRNNYLVRRVSMIKNAAYGLYYASGKHAGLPTVLHVNMMMWAHSPDPKMKNPAFVRQCLAKLKAITA